MCDFLTLLLRDVRDEIRQQHLCGADRLALARTCRTLYEEDGPELTDDLSHWLPPSWWPRSAAYRRGMASLSREDRPFVAALWRQIFSDRFDGIAHCRHQSPTLRLVKRDGRRMLWLSWPQLEVCLWQTPASAGPARAKRLHRHDVILSPPRLDNPDSVHIAGPPSPSPPPPPPRPTMNVSYYRQESAMAMTLPPFPVAALPGWITVISLHVWLPDIGTRYSFFPRTTLLGALSTEPSTPNAGAIRRLLQMGDESPTSKMDLMNGMFYSRGGDDDDDNNLLCLCKYL